jgi:hypothetical protein
VTLGQEDIITSDGKYPARAAAATPRIRDNARDLAERVDRLLTSFGERCEVSSGFRTQGANQAANGAAKSWHLFGCAVDLRDPLGELALYCLAEQDLLAHFGLWLEDPRWTRKEKQKDGTWKHRWVHLQTKPPASGRRVFRPAGPPPR